MSKNTSSASTSAAVAAPAAKRVTKKVPHPDALDRSLPVPDDGRYLVIWRGPVSILSVKDRVGGGVAEDLAYLAAHVPIADVLIWDCPPGEPTTLYSLLAGAKGRKVYICR